VNGGHVPTRERDDSCPICRRTAPRLRYRLPRHTILDCASCGQVYLRPLPSPEEVRAVFARLYATGEGPLPELNDYFSLSFEDRPDNPLVRLYERWLDRLERERRPGRLLDVGCGTGLFLAVARRRGWTPMGVDDSVEATEHARTHFALDVRVGDFDAVATEAAGRFDAVTLWDVVEHAREPVRLLAAAARCLAPGGVVTVATPNQRSILDVLGAGLYRLTGGRITGPLEKIYVPLHFLYFTPATLEAALGRAGLGLVGIERELTDLSRLALAPPTRLVLRALFRIAR